MKVLPSPLVFSLTMTLFASSSMNLVSYWSSRGYQLVRPLGSRQEDRDSPSGMPRDRQTFLAIHQPSQRPVVIKSFQFSQANGSWGNLEAIQQEVAVLRSLQHPGIPRYLESFSTPQGFCLIQEYKKAPTLAVPRTFSPTEIKQIAISLLEILVYLQTRIPSVIHRDIKPENILVDEKLNVFLVDFGLAKFGAGDLTVSSVAKGTLGFIAPEQLFHHQLLPASDLYSLGVTIVCLITGTPTGRLPELIDENYQLNFQHLVPQFSLRWLEWLKQMVEHRVRDRFQTASEALESLKPLDIFRTPEVSFHPPRIELEAHKLGQTLSHTFLVQNPIPETLLQGRWEIAPHPQDPPHSPDKHHWIKLAHREFSDNHHLCHLQINTRHLMADRTYDRELILHSNATKAQQIIPLQIKTAPLPLAPQKFPYFALGLLVLLASLATWMESLAWQAFIQSYGLVGVLMAVFVIALVAGFGVLAALGSSMTTHSLSPFLTRIKNRLTLQSLEVGIACLIAGLVAVGVTHLGAEFRAFQGAIVSFSAIDFFVFLTAFRAENLTETCLKRGFKFPLALGVSALAISLGICVGLGSQLSFLNPFVLAIGGSSSVMLGGLLLYPPLERSRLIANYRKVQQHLIQP